MVWKWPSSLKRQQGVLLETAVIPNTSNIRLIRTKYNYIFYDPYTEVMKINENICTLYL